MKYIKCDRCGAQINPLDNQSDITVISNFEIIASNVKTSVDLCERCTKQFYTHFMNNHYCYEVKK